VPIQIPLFHDVIQNRFSGEESAFCVARATPSRLCLAHATQGLRVARCPSGLLSAAFSRASGQRIDGLSHLLTWREGDFMTPKESIHMAGEADRSSITKTKDQDRGKGAVESDKNDEDSNTNMQGQLGHRDKNSVLKDADSDLPG
jgi:hypothetical protein